jgi:hypothetical protein
VTDVSLAVVKLHASAARVAAATTDVERSAAEAAHAAAVKSAATVEEQVQAQAKESLRGAVQTATVSDCSAAAELQGTVYKHRGCLGELGATTVYEKHTGAKVYNRKKSLTPGVMLGGRVDGIEDGRT